MPQSERPETGTGASPRGLAQQEREPLWSVVMMNDDYTPFDWVLDLLMSLFGRSHDEALAVTTSVHRTGRGIAGVYPRAKAMRLAAAAVRRAREAGYPFTCAAEPFVTDIADGDSVTV
jgi:ATP-dependent Clp protease adaptor protein ClpS